MLYKRNDDLTKDDHIKRIKSLLTSAGNVGTEVKLDENVFEKVILSTKEGMFKHWQVQYTFWEKNRLLAIHVSPEAFCRALQIMDYS